MSDDNTSPVHSITESDHAVVAVFDEHTGAEEAVKDL